MTGDPFVEVVEGNGTQPVQPPVGPGICKAWWGFLPIGVFFAGAYVAFIREEVTFDFIEGQTSLVSKSLAGGPSGFVRHLLRVSLMICSQAYRPQGLWS